MDRARLGRAAAGAAGRASALAVLVVALAVGSAPAAIVTGVADQRPAFFDSPPYRALAIDAVRLVVPWDAGLRAGPWDAWLARARRDGATVMVALEHDAESRCPAAPCVLPAPDAYGDALAALLARHPTVREVTAWNEPNHSSQPTFRHPDAAARYYEEARVRCPACTVVAGDVLDDVALPAWLSAYQAALTSTPDVWGLHNYYDATYFRSRGIRTLLAQTSGRLWLTETGGIVSFRPPGGPGLPYDERRAADGVAWLYELAERHPEIERMYLYQWQGTLANPFDSGLLGYDGTPRPAYGVVAARVTPRGPGAAATGSAPALTGGRAGRDAGRPRPAGAASGALRPGRSLRLLAGGRLEVRVRCIVRGVGGGRCDRRLVVRVAGVVVARLLLDVPAGRLVERVVRLAPGLHRHVLRARRPRAQLQACARRGLPCSARADVAVTRGLRGRAAQPDSRRGAARSTVARATGSGGGNVRPTTPRAILLAWTASCSRPTTGRRAPAPGCPRARRRWPCGCGRPRWTRSSGRTTCSGTGWRCAGRSPKAARTR